MNTHLQDVQEEPFKGQGEAAPERRPQMPGVKRCPNTPGSRNSPVTLTGYSNLSGGPAAKTPSSQCRGLGSIPGQGSRSHMP